MIKVVVSARALADAEALAARLRQVPDVEVIATVIDEGVAPGADAAIDVQHPRQDDPLWVEELTAREIEVLNLVAEGCDNRDIARRLGISRHTVKFHVSSVLAKLGARSRTAAVREGLRRGLVVI
jgi:DNA-binding NarL/FixJ family response regulator